MFLMQLEQWHSPGWQRVEINPMDKRRNLPPYDDVYLKGTDVVAEIGGRSEIIGTLPNGHYKITERKKHKITIQSTMPATPKAPATPATNKEAIQKGEICPYCSGTPALIDSSIFYGGRSYGLVWACRPCQAYVGVHKGTNKPLGRLANKELRAAKKAAHAAFDPIWQTSIEKGRERNEARSGAYEWLSQAMGMSHQDCHIGMMDVNECMQVVGICKQRKA